MRTPWPSGATKPCRDFAIFRSLHLRFRGCWLCATKKEPKHERFHENDSGDSLRYRRRWYAYSGKCVSSGGRAGTGPELVESSRTSGRPTTHSERTQQHYPYISDNRRCCCAQASDSQCPDAAYLPFRSCLRPRSTPFFGHPSGYKPERQPACLQFIKAFRQDF
jgi:hypothetical protein